MVTIQTLIITLVQWPSLRDSVTLSETSEDAVYKLTIPIDKTVATNRQNSGGVR